MFMVFNATENQKYFSYIWQSALLVDDAGVPEENHRPAASHWQTLSHNVVSSTALTHIVYELNYYKSFNPHRMRDRK